MTMLREWLVAATEPAIAFIDLVALVVIVAGTLQALAGMVMLFRGESGHLRRDIWLRYARWLIAGLTFQLAADILETSITTEWEAIARVGAIAVIRTFLNYFLERDLAEVRDRQKEPTAPDPPGSAG